MSKKPRDVFQRLRPPPSTRYHHGKPIFHQTIGHLFISVDFEEKDAGIWEYNLDSQTIVTKYKYPTNFQPFDHEICMDVDNDIIYLVGGSSAVFASFNLKTKTWNTQIYDLTKHVNDDDLHLPISIFIPSPINQIHTFFHNRHYKYIEEQQELIGVSDKIKTDTARLIYHASTKQLLMFKSENDDIWTCDIEEADKSIYEWKLYPIKLPSKLGHIITFDVFVAWNRILFLFDFNEGNVIYLIDLYHNKLFQISYVDLLSDGEIGYTIKDNQNNVHLIQFKALLDAKQFHCKASLYDLLPMDLIKLNWKRYEPLIMEYVKQWEQDKTYPILPFVLKQLIVQFYPIFV